MADRAEHDEALDTNVDVFRQAVDDCLALYRTSADTWCQSHPAEAASREADSRRELMDDLAHGLLVKVFLTILQADGRFSAEERELAQVLLHRLWGREFSSGEVGKVLQELIPMADKFDWYQLVRPFAEVPELHERTTEMETVVMRLGNLVAKADGTLDRREAIQLKGMLAEINRHLRPVPLDDDEPTSTPAGEAQAIRRALNAMPRVAPARGKTAQQAALVRPQAAIDEPRLEAALQSLDNLIGLDAIKNEVRELARFLRVQRLREQEGLPRTQVSLHTVFAGNPGTGKTSVARILGEVFGALGIVAKGHLIEADRSTLVAGFVGQTAERTNKTVDKALDGVLFIDEAYSLVSDEGDDPFGHEALQILLKRMEDNRDRLVVVLAGYPREMKRLLAANPGLSSRFQRTFDFPDYSAVDLCRIVQTLCDKNHYTLPAETRARLILGFAYLRRARDEHFGNGRLARNIFEQAIRRLANRVADIVPLTTELLTRLEPSDIVLADVPEAAVDADRARELQVSVICPGCRHASRFKATNLGRRVQCNKCHAQFTADWGEAPDDGGAGLGH